MLRQMAALRENQDVSVKASPDYLTNENDEYEMIQSLTDIKKFRDKDVYTSIRDGNDLAHLFYKSKMASYEPRVRFSVCVVSNWHVKLYIKKKSARCRIETHNLVTGSINGTITETTEQTYNNMSRAMYDFNTALFHPLHKSHYNDRTIPPVGEINR